MAHMIPCSKCGLSTSNSSGICHRHASGQRAYTRPQTSEKRYGAPPASSSIRVTQASAQAQADLAAVFPESADGVISSDRARQIAVDQLRGGIVNFAAHTFVGPEMDVLDVNARDQAAAQYINSIGTTPIRADYEDDRDVARDLRDYVPSDANQTLSKSFYLAEYALRKEHQIGRDAGATSSEGINYSSVDEDEFVHHIVNVSLRYEAQTHYRRCLNAYGKIFTQVSGRQPKSSLPFGSGLAIDDDFENPLGKVGEWTEDFEMDLIQDHHAELQRRQQEFQQRLDAEAKAKSERRKAQAAAVVGGIASAAEGMSNNRQQTKAARARAADARRNREAQDAMIRMGEKMAPSKPWWMPY